MMDRILFIVPPCVRFADFINPNYNIKVQQKNDGVYGNVVTDMPLGVLALSSYVKKYTQVETKLVDFTTVLNKLDSFGANSFTEFFDDYLSLPEFLDYNPTIIGISALFTPSYQNVIDIAASSCNIFQNATVIAGGGVPQNMYKNVYKDIPKLDGICYGEGERPLLELLEAKDKRKYLEESSSWITHSKVEHGQFRHNFIVDLDEIPFYDYDLCEVEDYSLNPAITAYAAVGAHAANFHIMTSRGCPQHCTFCASHTIHGRDMRYYSVDRVRDDFTKLKEKYGAKILVFQDDHLMGDTKRAYKIVKIVGELGLTAVFQNGLALYALKRDMLEAMSEAGVEQLTLPVESGSQRVLKKIMKKPLSPRIVERVANDCRDLGIYTNVNILIGMPGETKEDIEEAKAFLKKINCNWFIILFATPLAGSEMLDVCLENDYLTGSYVDTDFKKAIVETEDFTASYISKEAYSMNLELNFVENADFRLGEYERALIGMENAIRAKSDHALAYYYSGRCYEKLGNLAKAQKHLDTAKAIIEDQPFWREYAEKFNIFDFSISYFEYTSNSTESSAVPPAS